MHGVQGERPAPVVNQAMTPETVHLIARQIRHFRELLVAEERWLRSQDRNELVPEMFRRINFWRGVLNYAEKRLSS